MSATLDFSNELDAYQEQLETKIAPRFAKDVLELAIRTLVKLTPRDSGHLRGNWWIGNPGGSQIFEDNAVLTRARRAVSSYKLGDQVAIVNDLAYASVVDQGEFDPSDPGPSRDPRPGRRGKILVSGGYSTQAPRGMTEPTIEELDDVFFD
ncbi:neck protein [Caudoviricetes sp.]|nr:neck protein [Caudoviricetes sp.]UOF82720.1 neck protein [Caudoviricetes sp.]